MIDYFTDPPVLPGVDYFTDPPAQSAPQGLQPGECADCGGHALVDAQYEGTVRCSACWTKFHGAGRIAAVPFRSAPRSYVVKPWISQSERGARRNDIATSSVTAPPDQPVGDEDGTEVGRYRVITPARPAAPEQVPATCAKLAADLPSAGHASEDITITYALAEDLKLERPVATVALRLYGFGYAIWRDGKPLTAQVADPLLRTCSVTEFSALALGKPYTKPKAPEPAPKGPCPRCGTVVRWTKSGTYKHNTKSQDGEKIECLLTSTAAPNGSASQTVFDERQAMASLLSIGDRSALA